MEFIENSINCIGCPSCGCYYTEEEERHLLKLLMGKYIGRKTSEKKAAAAVANGRSGGRPKGSKNKPKAVTETDNL